MSQPAWTITNKAGIIECIGKSPAAAHGVDVPQAVGKSPGQVWGGKMERQFYDTLWEHIERDNHATVATLYNRRADGTYGPETLCILPLITAEREQLFLAVQENHLAELKHANEDAAQFDDVVSVLQTLFSTYESGLMHKPLPLSPHIGSWVEEIFVVPARAEFAARHEDAALIAKAKVHTDAFGELYTRYYDDVYAYTLRRVSSPQTAEDVTQEVFIKALRHLPNFVVRNSTYKTFLLRVAHRAIIDRYRAERAHQALQDGDLTTVQNNDKQHIRQLLALLPTLDAELIRAKHIYGYSIRELAEQHGVSENAVKLRLSRARKKLRNLV